MRKLLAWMVVVVVLSNGSAVGADLGTLYVDHDGVCAGNSPCYTSIQSAIDAANPGDTVFVYPRNLLRATHYRQAAVGPS